MTREEAIKAVVDVLGLGDIAKESLRHEWAALILDAIGFDQMQELLDWRGREIASLTDVVIRLGRERDVARALADQLAAALKDSGADGHPAHTYEHTLCGLCMEEAALDAYEARDWK